MFSPALRRLIAILLLFMLGQVCIQNVAISSSSDTASAILSLDVDMSDDAASDRPVLLPESYVTACIPQHSSFPRSPNVNFQADPGLVPPPPPPDFV